MKKYFIQILILTFVVLSGFSYGDEIQSAMKKGNELYKNSQFQSAIDEYNILVKKGYEGYSLYYNLGNAHYRLGKIGYAILYYEKAHKISPSDEDVKHNLLLAKQNLKDKVETLPPFFVFEIWEGLLGAFSASGWTIVTYLVFLLLLASLIAYFFSRNSLQQKISFFTGTGLFSVLIFSIILLAVKMNKEFNIKDAIILEPSVTAKFSPDESANDNFIIHEGLKVRIEDKVDNWYKIRLEDGKVGWVSKNELGII